MAGSRTSVDDRTIVCLAEVRPSSKVFSFTCFLQASDALDTGGRLSQKFGADLSRAGDNRVSGDADIPSKAPLADRRAKLDNVCHLPQDGLVVGMKLPGGLSKN